MTTFARSINNDIFLSAKSIGVVEGKSAYALAIIDSIRTLYGEIQLNTELGIPYMETVFKGYKYLRGWRIDVRRRIMMFDFVLGITKFEIFFVPEERTLTYVINIKTEDGIVTVGDVLYNIDTNQRPDGDDDDDYMALTQDGIFYLPVFIADGVQVYRTLTQYVSEEMGTVTTVLSEKTYIKVGGKFVERTSS